MPQLLVLRKHDSGIGITEITLQTDLHLHPYKILTCQADYGRWNRILETMLPTDISTFLRQLAGYLVRGYLVSTERSYGPCCWCEILQIFLGPVVSLPKTIH